MVKNQVSAESKLDQFRNVRYGNLSWELIQRASGKNHENSSHFM